VEDEVEQRGARGEQEIGGDRRLAGVITSLFSALLVTRLIIIFWLRQNVAEGGADLERRTFAFR
jgi:hypothetical protein